MIKKEVKSITVLFIKDSFWIIYKCTGLYGNKQILGPNVVKELWGYGNRKSPSGERLRPNLQTRYLKFSPSVQSPTLFRVVIGYWNCIAISLVR